MIIQYGQALSNYLYDVFVAKFDFWLAFGLVAQLFFTARFLVQWIASERAAVSSVHAPRGTRASMASVPATRECANCVHRVGLGVRACLRLSREGREPLQRGSHLHEALDSELEQQRAVLVQRVAHRHLQVGRR